MNKVVIVESPAKSKTIEKYLGSDFTVVSSKGHIRDLATSGKFGLGVDIDNNFAPKYIIIKGKNKDVSALKKLTDKADMVYLATDPDREGEAISWHLFDELKIPDDKYERVVFNEITKNVVKEAIDNPRKIDMDLVHSQETRRILDRIIGFRLSKLMQSKTGGKSAGRVQSVALKIIVDREREIEAFNPEEYWTITSNFGSFEATLEKYHGKNIEIKNEVEANEILDKLSNSFEIDSIDETEKNRKSKEVFRTSTMQQAIYNKYGFDSSKTMRIAQKLYEGIDLGDETVGLITYMRTDSVRVSPEFVKDTFGYIKGKYGPEYVGSVKTGKKNENIQDAHEGIRPTSINRKPEDVKEYLTTDEYKVYKMIYYRALASLMADSKYLSTTVNLNNNGYLFKASGSVTTFDGYLKAYGEFEEKEDNTLPDFKSYKSKTLVCDEINKEQHFTKAPARYTESTLIKELEALGIGRPSTYATIMQTIKARGYVSLVEKRFVPTKIGIETNDKLQEFFDSIINVEYTANMEKDLDEIAEDKKDSTKVLKDFYAGFEPLLDKAFNEMEKKQAEETGEMCPNCGSPLVIRNGRFGEFVACSNYPKCKYIKQEEREVNVVCKCPKCSSDIVEKRTRRGKIFYGCSNYPKCDFAVWNKPIDRKCPECGNILTEKGKKIVCSSCDYSE